MASLRLPEHRPRLAAAAFYAGLFLLAALFFWKLAFTNLILARGDLFLYFYPYWDYRAQALLAGLLPAPQAVKVAILAHIALAAVGAGVFARWALRLRTLPAFLAAAVFSLGG